MADKDALVTSEGHGMHVQSTLLTGFLFLIAFSLANPVSADPPSWAPAHGYRAKHGSGHKHKHHKHKHKHHHERKHGRDDDDHIRHAEYGSGDADHDRYRERNYRHKDLPPARASECIRKVTTQEAGAVFGETLGGQISSGNPTAQMTGSLLGAIVGGRMDGPVPQSDEDCVRDALEDTRDAESRRWTDLAATTEYELTPLRTYRNGDRRCRDFVTTVVHGGKLRKVQRSACRNKDGAWRVIE